MAGMEATARKYEHYNYADYVTWDTDERYELIDGVPYLMTPSPSVSHQEVSGNLHMQLKNHVAGGPCRVYYAPMDVRLNADAADDTVVQPDLMVVCDKSKIGKGSIDGAPDIVVEIISPSSEHYDTGAKLDKYLGAGVRECWMVNPEARTVRIYAGDGGGLEGRYRVYGETGAATSEVLRGLVIPLSEIFSNT
jgi:Uma2 family endonuclease